MPVPENDLELLEVYLDGELSDQDAQDVRRRLEQESALTEAAQLLRAQRRARTLTWDSMEPDDATVSRVLARIERKLQTHRVWVRRFVKIKMVSAAAACIVIGFITGWYGRAVQAPSFTPESMFVTEHSIDHPALAGPVDLPLVDEYGRVVAVQTFDSLAKAREFIEDWRQWQEQQEQIHSGNIKLVADRF